MVRYLGCTQTCLLTSVLILGIGHTEFDWELDDGMYVEFYLRRRPLEASDDRCDSILNGGEAIYAKARNHGQKL